MIKHLAGSLVTVGIVAASMAQPATTSPLRSEWNLVDHLPMDSLVLQSHRGAGELGPDNTLEGFKMGWSFKTAPEADVRTTTDGVIVAFHDTNLKRVVKNCPPELHEKGVQDLTWAQVQALRVGAGQAKEFPDEPIPRMADVFALMQGQPDRHLYLDIKQVDLAKLAALVNEHGVAPQVTLATPKHEIIREWKRLVPKSDTLLWTRGTEPEMEEIFNKLREANFEGITQLQIHIHLKGPAEAVSSASVDPFKLSDAFLIKAGNELRSRNIVFQTFPYGGTTAGVYAKLMHLGVMSFATDRPDVTREAIRAYFMENSRPTKTHRNSTLLLSPRNLKDFTAAAGMGDSAAAWKLYLHYSLGASNKAEGEVWLKRANDLGNKNAAKILAIRGNKR